MHLITTALVAALDTDAGGLHHGGDAVGRAYGQLKVLLLRRFGADADLAGLLGDLERDPGALSRQAMLDDMIEQGRPAAIGMTAASDADAEAQAEVWQALLDGADALLEQIRQAGEERGELGRTQRDHPKAEAGGAAITAAAAVPVPANYAVVQAWFATDRSMLGEGSDSDEADGVAPAQRFGGARGQLHYGLCEVSIPRDHRMGELEAPSLLRLEFRPDPAKHVVLLDVQVQDTDTFFAALRARIGQSAKREALLFVHGYDTTFEDAARRTGQMAYDLGFAGAPVFYSWPSPGLVSAYVEDGGNMEWSQAHLKAFLADFLQRCDANSVYLIAHSMGSRGLSRAVAELMAEQPTLVPRLREIILSAPDIDAAVFRDDIAPALARGGRPVTLYASSRDLAMAASEKLNGYPRAGDSGAGLVVVEGVETIDATGVDTGFLKHSYFGENRSALSDMFYLISTGARAAQRFGLVEVDTAAGMHWAFKR